ncbi:hypothetical protein BZG36_03169 [Bifiguratus adelaidae]|uniref:Tautomerase cis-CaaD-like domain-containing protein n=1 Tax=Bifiguratus adelaidae TaxID=1938954 RepID=A0A261Y146_9FUNG|nr:hypothetical protein BZG36_03169 [Bifiguratus adelaidae]
MPLHRIYHPKGVFSEDDKRQISQRLTKMYTDVGLPPFYVVVVFLPSESEDLWVGGEKNDHFVRIVSQHLARTMPTDDVKVNAMDRIDEAFAPFVKDRGLEWELHIEEVERDLWRENGLVPPMPGTEAEKLWVKHNKPVPYEGMPRISNKL